MAGRWPRTNSRAAILRVFAEHVAERGYAETNLTDVAAELGLVKGTVLHHFGTKEALLGEVHAAYFARRFAEADFIRAELGDPVQRLAAMIYALLAAHRDDRAASLATLRELVRYFDGDLTEYVRDQRVRYTRIVVDILRDGVDQGVFHTDDPTMTALHVFGMCNYAWTWYRPEGRQSMEQIARRFSLDLVRGLVRADGEPTNGEKKAGAGKDDAEKAGREESGEEKSGEQTRSMDLDRAITRAIETVQRAPGRLPPLDEPAASTA